MFLEPKRSYRALTGEVVDDGTACDLDACFVVRDGTDVTLVSWGAMLPDVLHAAEALAEATDYTSPVVAAAPPRAPATISGAR